MAAKELINTILKNSANLKAYYRFESGALTTDSSGNGNTLTNTNSVAEGVGVFGVCADFGASNTNKELNHSSDYAINGGVCTLGGWFKVTTYPTSGNAAVPLYMSDDTSRTWFQIVHYNNSGTKQIAFHRSKNGVGQEGVSYFNYDPGTDWHFYVMTYDGTNVRCYIDGAYRSIGAASGNGTTATTQKFSIGNSGHSGLVDDVFIFNTALSADQIKELYEGRFLGEGWPQSGLVGGWHLNGNSTDFSGNNNHGTDTNMTYPLSSGKFNQGANFVYGSSCKITIPGTSFNFTSGNFTISFWMNRQHDSYTGGGYWILGNSSDGVNNGYAIYLFLTTLNFTTYTNQRQNLSIGTITKNIWKHIVVIKNGSSLTSYIDGNLTGTLSLTANITSTSNSLKFGVYPTSDIDYYGGFLDEVQIYNVAKDANWVRKQYGLGIGKFY